ncbi:hypothetical protein I6M55_15560 [Shewanella algae]|nr:hypothetical protein [Shewanella algae]
MTVTLVSKIMPGLETVVQPKSKNTALADFTVSSRWIACLQSFIPTKTLAVEVFN